eukprot:TRINITY_DN398_c0_g1_i10.p2 TRINITY_DN398_c0_g1~~TRINITY_DN398_c0_g1_i10.p2  ORF type:complete len:110 (+),score=20.07 TRINITY_DN398_c0_g1_i10:1162-1491(+)
MYRTVLFRVLLAACEATTLVAPTLSGVFLQRPGLPVMDDTVEKGGVEFDLSATEARDVGFVVTAVRRIRVWQPAIRRGIATERGLRVVRRGGLSDNSICASQHSMVRMV